MKMIEKRTKSSSRNKAFYSIPNGICFFVAKVKQIKALARISFLDLRQTEQSPWRNSSMNGAFL